MYIYLLALTLFAGTALLVGAITFIRGIRKVRLLPLFLVVLSQAVVLILALAGANAEQPSTIISLLNVFTTFCVVWTLTGPLARLSPSRQRAVWVSTVLAILLIFLTALPRAAWPVPPMLHSLLIAIFGASLIFLTVEKPYWSEVAAPLILAGSNFLFLIGLTSIAWFVNLLAYVLLIATIHHHSLSVGIKREQMAQELVQEALTLDRERQRFFEASETISNVPNLNHILEHIARSMVHLTHTDQAAIFILNSNFKQEARLLTLYSPHKPFHITNPNEVTCLLPDCPPLEKVVTERQQGYFQEGDEALNPLYTLWNGEQSGPTLLQPLVLQGRSIGVLLLSNALSQTPIRREDTQLCQRLAGQIALLVENRRRYLELESEAAAMTHTAKKQSEPPNQQYAAILAKISDGVIVSNQAGQVQFVNRAAERILGKSERTLTGQPLRTIYNEIDAKTPGDDLIASFARRDQPLPIFIEEAERAVQGRLISWRNEYSEWLGVIAIFRDVTREVKADRARNDFIAALSRELRTPLTTIKGYSELILNGLMEDYPPQYLQIQQIIHTSSERVVEILDNAIKISAQNRHQVLPRFEEVDVAKMIESTTREIQPLAQLHEIEIKQKIDPELAPIMADVKHVHRILYNLLSNACRFTPPGGRILVRAWLQMENGGGTLRPYLFISVADNGVGILQEELSRIFDRFYQIKHPHLSHNSGMGLGLTVVKELVELHNGRIWAKSLLGKGSVFHVALPTSQEY